LCRTVRPIEIEQGVVGRSVGLIDVIDQLGADLVVMSIDRLEFHPILFAGWVGVDMALAHTVG
jgi:hypothetical protein